MSGPAPAEGSAGAIFPHTRFFRLCAAVMALARTCKHSIPIIMPWQRHAKAALMHICRQAPRGWYVTEGRIKELTSAVQKRFNFPEGSVELYAEKVATRGLCAIAQAESLRYKLIGGLAVRRACYGVL